MFIVKRIQTSIWLKIVRILNDEPEKAGRNVQSKNWETEPRARKISLNPIVTSLFHVLGKGEEAAAAAVSDDDDIVCLDWLRSKNNSV